MKIQIDANPAYSSQLTGIGYFTDELIKHMSEECEVEGFAFNFMGKKNFNKAYKVQEQKILPGKLLTLPRYLSLDLPLNLFFKNDGDLIVGTNFLLPPTGKTKNIVMVHDLCFIDHPEWVQDRNALILRKMVKKSLSRSSGLIANSQFTADRVKDYYGYDKPILTISIPPKKSKVEATVPRNIDEKYNFFLFVSTIEPRKNLKTLLDAYEKLPVNTQEKYKLIVAGKPGWDPVVLKRLRSYSNKNIIYLDYVSESEKKWLYKNATATIIPSHYEGFGMMTLESLDAGTPVITSDIPPQREILGNDGVYFDPTNTNQLTKYLTEFTDKNTRNDALARQSRVLKDYSWDNTAKKVVDFCKSII